MPLVTLKKRAEFLRVRGGLRYACPAFVLEAKAHERPASGKPASSPPLSAVPAPPRFGFTVTKALGGAVVRNRIRRRLKAGIADIAAIGARPGFDYVLIARAGAGTADFSELKKDLALALQRVHHAGAPREKRKGARPRV